jgi:hypothetical protein
MRLELYSTGITRNFIANLSRRTVYVFRCYPAHGISNEHYTRLRAFWQAYFQRAGGHPASLRIERNVDRVLPERGGPGRIG